MHTVATLSLILGSYFVLLYLMRRIIPYLHLRKNFIRPQLTKFTSPMEARSFQNRPSPLDSSEDSQGPFITSQWKGFMNLAGVAMYYFVAGNNLKHFMKTGTLIGLKSFWELFSRGEVFLVWGLLLLYSFLSVTIVKADVRYKFGYISYKLLHALFILSLFAGTLTVTFSCDWPIVPKASLLAELFIIAMKVHSYLVINRKLIMEEKNSKDNNHKNSNLSHITYSNFLDFLLIPVLVYEKSYPRTESVRVGYVIEKACNAIGSVAFLHIICDQYIAPVLQNSPTLSSIEAVMELLVPFFFCYMIVFYLVFDCLCNGFAELTKFADREFYKDWWNSTSLDEFARNWNKPVHEWLWRHIYLQSLESFNISKDSAMFLTFLFSSIAHEGLMIFCFQMIRPYLFVCQMAQIPLIIIGKELKGTRLGNWCFLSAITIGIPLLSVMYCTEYYAKQMNT